MKKNCTIQDIRDRALKSFLELDFSNKTSKKFNNEGEMIFDYSNSQKYKTEVAAIKAAENIKKKIESDIGTWASDNGFSDFKKGWLNLRFGKNKVILKFKFKSCCWFLFHCSCFNYVLLLGSGRLGFMDFAVRFCCEIVRYDVAV